MLAKYNFLALVAMCSLALSSSGVEGRRCNNGKPALTRAKVQEIKGQLSRAIQGDNIPRALRLSFHDCVGGCDGCINPADPSNAGFMLRTWSQLDTLYNIEKYFRVLSRADYYALAGIVAMENGIANANADRTTPRIPVPRINFQYCREDCPTAPTTRSRDNFPGATFTNREVYDYFLREFGLDDTLTTALMGAHTLGQARSQGYLGFWKEGQPESIRMDNRYYSLMIDRSLRYEQVDANQRQFFGAPRWQWEAFNNSTNKQVAFMLQADIAIYRDLDLDQSGRSPCEPYIENCPGVPTVPLVREYASNGTQWIQDFARAFTSVINNGATNLVDLA